MERERYIAFAACVKVIMTTALADKANVIHAREMLCDAFLVESIRKARLLEELNRLGLERRERVGRMQG